MNRRYSFRKRAQQETGTGLFCPECGNELADAHHYRYYLDNNKNEDKTELYLCENCRLVFDNKTRIAGKHHSARQLKYVFSDGATGKCPSVWKWEEFRFYSDNTIEFNRGGYVFDGEENTSIGSSLTFKLTKNEMSELEERIEKIIEVYLDATGRGILFSHVYDGGEYSIEKYKGSKQVASLRCQDYDIDPALKELFDILERLTHSEWSRVSAYGDDDDAMRKLLVRGKQLSKSIKKI